MRDVLVVDDDPGIRQMLIDLLGAEGYQVAGARNGSEALRHLREHQGSFLLLLDLMMPEMDGYAVLQALHRDPDTRARCRVVMMSASERLAQGGMDGADGALPKPFDLMDLLDVVEMFDHDEMPARGEDGDPGFSSWD